MLRNYKRVSLNNSIIAIHVLVNAVIIGSAFTASPRLYWLLLVTIPLLAGAIYYSRRKNPAEKKRFTSLIRSTFTRTITGKDLFYTIGNNQCARPYRSSILNMIFERYSLPAAGDMLQDTRAKGMNAFHLTGGGLLWQVDRGCAGDRAGEGGIGEEQLKRIAASADIRMIAVKRCWNHGTKDNCEYATPFMEAEGLIHFLGNLREYSAGKPVGLSLGIGNKKSFHEVCYAIRKTQLIPDFIIVEGAGEEAPGTKLEDNSYGAMPLYEALLFVSKTLQLYGLEKEIRIIAAGRISSGFDMLKLLALGADGAVIDISRPGIAIHSAADNSTPGFSAPLYQCAVKYHGGMLAATARIMDACGFKNVKDITLSNLFRRMDMLQ
jgi:hypothetical protein